MNLRTITTAALLCGTLVSSASADFIQYKVLNALHLSASYGMLDLDTTSTTSVNYELGYDIIKENYIVGFSYTLEAPTDTTYLSYGSYEMDLGYRVTPKAHVYGLVSYDFSDGAVAGGVGFGLGAKYQVFDSIALMSKVKYTSMSAAIGNDYGKTVATVGVEFNFRKGDGSTRW